MDLPASARLLIAGIFLGGFGSASAVPPDAVSFATYLAGNTVPGGLAVDGAGNLYITGQVAAATANAGSTADLDLDVYVAKLSPGGSEVQWIKTFGGSQTEWPTGLAVAPDGSVYVAGVTLSNDFPTTPRSLQPQPPIDYNKAFVVKLDAAGRIQFATYLGVLPSALAVTSQGELVLTAGAGGRLTEVPATPGALDLSPAGGAFLIRLDPSGSKLLLVARGIGGAKLALDQQGNMYVAGQTSTLRAFTTANAFQKTFPLVQGESPFPAICYPSLFGFGFSYPCQHQYVAKIDASGSKLIYATFLSGTYGASPGALAVDAAGNAYVAGGTNSTDYPVTPGAFQAENRARRQHAFLIPPPLTAYVSKLSPDGSALVYSTYLGGSVQESASGLALDAEGNVLAVGFTSSPDFPGVSGQPAPCLPGLLPTTRRSDFFVTNRLFVTKLGADGSSVPRTFLFGSTDAAATSLVRSGEAVYIAGPTNNLTTRSAGLPDRKTFLARVNFAAPAVGDGLACVTDAADGAVAGFVSPGELLALHGVQLADTAVIAPFDSGDLPTELGGIRVLFDDVAAPLLYTSPGQINTIGPCEVTGRSATRMVIERGGAPGEPRLLPLVPRSPSAFLRDPRTPPCDGSARQEPSAPPVLLNEDGSLNSCNNPAVLGSVVTVFLNGLGVTPSKPGTGTVIPPAASIPLDLPIEPQRMVVSATAGQVAGVWQVRIRLIGLSPPVGDISLKIDGTPLRQYLLTVFVK